MAEEWIRKKKRRDDKYVLSKGLQIDVKIFRYQQQHRQQQYILQIKNTVSRSVFQTAAVHVAYIYLTLSTHPSSRCQLKNPFVDQNYPRTSCLSLTCALNPPFYRRNYRCTFGHLRFYRCQYMSFYLSRKDTYVFKP